MGQNEHSFLFFAADIQFFLGFCFTVTWERLILVCVVQKSDVQVAGTPPVENCENVLHVSVCVRVCVRVCVCACVRACVRVCGTLHCKNEIATLLTLNIFILYMANCITVSIC